MNAHLNIFKSYNEVNTDYQLENDLTRAFAICMQEDVLFFREVLNAIIEPAFLNNLFADMEVAAKIAINIQQKTNTIEGFDKIYAVSLSEQEMNLHAFWQQQHHAVYAAICDLVVKINGIVIIFEAKRDATDCTAQLYNQAFNICNQSEINIDQLRDFVVPVDLNWPKLMAIAAKVLSFERAAGVPNRLLNDFVSLVKNHNFRWLPELPINAIAKGNLEAIKRRLASAVAELNKGGRYEALTYSDRLGLWFEKQWAQEILFDVHDNGDLHVKVYPGNTKGQGALLFQKDPKPKQTLKIHGKSYDLRMTYHIKLTSFQKFFTGLWFTEDKLIKPLYTSAIFWQYTGRKKRGSEWIALEQLFDEHFHGSYNWRTECKWDSKVIDSGRNQFDISFGYEFCLEIPFDYLKEMDRDRTNITPLTQLLSAVYTAFETLYDE